MEYNITINNQGGVPESKSKSTSTDVINQKNVNLWKKTKILLTTNRWILLAFYSFYIYVMGPAYMNWAPLRDILYWSGAFKWKCNPNETSPTASTYISPQTGTCLRQKLDVASLFTICTTVDLGFSFVGGILLDLVGPKLTCLFGASTMTFGWLLLSMSCEDFNAYKIGVGIHGFGVDAAFFGTMPLAYLFPGHENTVLSFLGGIRYLSYVTPVCLHAFMDPKGVGVSYRSAMLVFFGLLMCGIIVAAIFVPLHSWKKQTKPSLLVVEEQNQDHPIESRIKEFECHCDIPQSSSILENDKEMHDVTMLNTNVNHVSGRKKAGCIGYMSKILTPTLSLVGHGKNFLHEVMCEPVYLTLPPYATISILRAIYFIDCSEEIVPDALKFFHIIMAFVFIAPPIFGVIADRFNSIVMLLLVNTAGTLTFACVLVAWIESIVPFQYLAVVFSWLFTPLVTNSVYMFASDTFPQHHLGKIVGSTCTLAGVISFSVHSMYEYSLTAENGFVVMLSIFLGLSFVVYALIFVADCLLKRHSHRKQIS